jgi:hypothetical protein
MKKYILGVITGIVVSLLVAGAISGIAIFKSISDGPSGGGSFLESPDGKMIAKINNEYQNKKTGKPAYYEFSVTTPDHFIIVSRKILAGGKALNFRVKNAEDYIEWSADSKMVIFSDGDNEIWREDLNP